MVEKLQIRVVVKKKSLMGWAQNSCAYVNAKHVTSSVEIIDTIEHEILHLILGKIARTTEKQDHYIMKRLQLDWF